jgi:phosphatidylserine synthase
MALAIVSGLVLLTFVPILSLHPFRVAGLRSLNVAVTALWTLAAIGAVTDPFPSPLWVRALLFATAAYLIGVGIMRFLQERSGTRAHPGA